LGKIITKLKNLLKDKCMFSEDHFEISTDRNMRHINILIDPKNKNTRHAITFIASRWRNDPWTLRLLYSYHGGKKFNLDDIDLKEFNTKRFNKKRAIDSINNIIYKNPNIQRYFVYEIFGGL
jgi:hypothetical protein